MLIVGLTGSIGMGKSTAADYLKQQGVPVFDADAAVHRLYDGPLAAAIEAAFPGTVRDDVVDRQALSRSLMAEPERFKDLERIVHPAVRAVERAFLIDAFAAGHKMAVLEIPLLFETGADALVDAVIVVSAGPDVQRERVMRRAGMTAAKLDALLARQTSDEEKRRRADFIVDTRGTIEASQAQIADILSKLQARPANAFEAHWR